MLPKKILIVDDEKDVLLTLSTRLKSEGFKVITAETAKEALIVAKTQLPDLLILDVMLPDMQGGDLGGKLKRNPRTANIPIIYLTALLSKSEELSRGHVTGDNITFSKPYDEIKLIEQIEKMLGCNTIETK